MIDVVCGLIRNANGKFLVCRRPEGKHLGGLWEFPGGKVEAGELPQEALVRELREELGIQVAVEDGLSEVEWTYPAVKIRLLPYFCRILEGEPNPVEHSEISWCGKNAFCLMEWAPADLPVINEILALSDFSPE